MSRIAFLDPVSLIPYGGAAGDEEALGGTEATALRVARELVRCGHDVSIGQKARRQTETDSDGVKLLPYDPGAGLGGGADHVILVRADKLMARVSRQHPHARRWLWLHCFPGQHRRGMVGRAERAGFSLLTVSQSLRKAVLDGSPGSDREDLVEVVYNPVDVGALSTVPARDQNKLVFFSSPHKGLEQVLEHFQNLRRAFPELSLHVANPGYLPSATLQCPGVVNLGPLSHREVLAHVAEAFCVFMPQSIFAETFGLVFAEANALGTPVLTHPLGAAPEVLTPCQLVDCRSFEAVRDRFRQWREHGPPAVHLRPEFTMEAVSQRWLDLLQLQPTARVAGR